MYRVELKVACPFLTQELIKRFLMYRVELKVAYKLGRGEDLDPSFLMYRVELKGRSSSGIVQEIRRVVPNVPCGVERSHAYANCCARLLLLMYRVELKDTSQLFPI